MRRCCLVMMAGLAVMALVAGPVAAEKVEVKGPHICCKQCVNVVNGLLGKLDGVSDVNPDPKGPQRTVTIEAAGLDRGEVIEALKKAGFYGSLAN